MSKEWIANTFQTPNYVIDEMMSQLPDATVCAYLFLIRKTIGYGKEFDRISVTQFEKFTGKSKSTILKVLGELESIGLIERQQKRGLLTTYKPILNPSMDGIDGLKAKRKAESEAAKERKNKGSPEFNNEQSSPEFAEQVVRNSRDNQSGIPDPTKPNTTKPNLQKEKAEKLSSLENQKQERQEPDPRILGGNCQKPDKTCRCPKCKTAVIRLMANNQKLWGKERYFDCPSRNTMFEHWSGFNTDLSVESILDEITRSIANGEYRKGDMKPFATVIDHAIATLEYAK